MANEKANAMVTEATESKATEQAVKTAETNPIFITREKFKMRDGRSLWSYVVRGKKYGHDIKAEFVAKDRGGYGFLDMLFDISEKVELVVHEETTESASGRVSYYMVYEAQGVDENGEIVSIKIRPKQDSDKAYLALILGNRGGEATA